jgi:hypothetical protein
MLGDNMKARNLMAIVMVGLMLVAAISGCVGGPGGAGGNGTSGDATTHADYSAAYSDFVGDMQNYEYSKEYAFLVDEGAKKAAIDVKLGMNAEGLPFPPSCYITVAIKDPAGSDAGSVTLDPATTTEATLTLTSFKSYGSYKVTVTGYGMAGYGYGGKYDLKIDVNYS